MLDLHRLMLLREVYLRGSMTEAARRLSYSHSAISQQLAQLERETGVSLLERVGRNVRLTTAGEELVHNSEAIWEAVERAESDLASAHERPQGLVRIAGFATVNRTILPTVVQRLGREFPGLDVRVRHVEPEEAGVALSTRQVDAVITDAYPGTEGLPTSTIHATVLGTDPVRAYIPATVDPTDVHALKTLRWVMEPETAAARHWALRVLRERGIDPVIAYVSTDLLFHLRLVQQGLAGAFLPDMVVREAGSTLIPTPLMPAGEFRTILFLVRAGSEAKPSLAAVRDAVSAALTQNC